MIAANPRESRVSRGAAGSRGLWPQTCDGCGHGLFAVSRSVFMKPIKSLLVLAIVCAPALASAQGYYGRGGSTVPGGFHNRAGRLTYGFSIGLGGMHDDGSSITSCDNCDFKPLAFEGDFHLGGMLSPQFGLMFEGQVNIQTIHSDRFNGDTTLTQGAAMLAAQFWVLPQVWLKGGV